MYTWLILWIKYWLYKDLQVLKLIYNCIYAFKIFIYRNGRSLNYTSNKITVQKKGGSKNEMNDSLFLNPGHYKRVQIENIRFHSTLLFSIIFLELKIFHWMKNEIHSVRSSDESGLYCRWISNDKRCSFLRSKTRIY